MILRRDIIQKGGVAMNDDQTMCDSCGGECDSGEDTCACGCNHGDDSDDTDEKDGEEE